MAEDVEDPFLLPGDAGYEDAIKARPDGQAPTWSEAAKGAFTNFIPSAGRMIGDMYQAVRHPIDTGSGLYDIGKGLYSKAEGALGFEQDPAQKAQTEAAANAVGKFYADRYGGLMHAPWSDEFDTSGLRRTLAEDPAGLLGDASIALGGASLPLKVAGAGARAAGLAEVGGMASRLGAKTAGLGAAIDPITLGARGLGVAGKIASYPASFFQGKTFGMRPEAFRNAYEAGAVGDREFFKAMNGGVGPEQVIENIQGGLGDVAKEQHDAYVAGMDPIKRDQTHLPYNHIVDTFNTDIKNHVMPYGFVKNEEALQAAKDVSAKIAEAMGANSPNSHTIGAFDALKQAIGEMKNNYKHPSARKVVDMAYNAARKTITDFDPEYGNVMEQYAKAADNINDLRNNFGVNTDKRTVTQNIRKILKGSKDENAIPLLEQLVQRRPELGSHLKGMEIGSQHAPNIVERGTNIAGNIAMFAGKPWHAAALMAASPTAMGNINYLTGKVANVPLKATKMVQSPSAISRAGMISDPDRLRVDITQPGGEPYSGDEDPGFDLGDGTTPPAYASGGRVSSHDAKADALVMAAERARKAVNRSTEPLLATPDETVARALEIAQQHI